MKVQDLRIGNYVYNSQKEVIKIHNIISGYEIETLKPIPLTEDWLFKFENVKRLKNSEALEVFERFNFIFLKEYNFYYVLTKSGDYLTKIEFIHEYQNFIYTLTGEELTN
jgi:hypothetical protein